MEFSQRKTKSVGCSYTARKYERLRFFRFPKVGVSVVINENTFGEPKKVDQRIA